MADDRKQELQDVVKSMLPDPVFAMGYMEHQIDIMGQIIVDLLGLVDTSKLTSDQQERITALKGLLQYSSIDFSNLSSPLQSYKIPKATELKAYTRQVQQRYLEKQLKEGLLT